ncbi:hypothetical protein IMZ48_09945 [Candidatus Bathyarchaeota archaeon]|nr:hypothetical protein [Candidatus Bathyarchaeota archaeon]
MAQPKSATDLILSIHPRHVSNILTRVKNHEFRNYPLPPTVRRLWIYETSPASAIRYVATISHGKKPGEICDPTGLRNDEFDRGESAGRVKYAYEILRLEELEEPWTLAALKKNGWLGGAPQKYCFVKGEMVAALGDVSLRLLFDTKAEVEAGDGDGEAKLDAAPTVARRDQLKKGPPAGVQKSKSQPLRVSSRNKASHDRYLGSHIMGSEQT